MTKAHVLNLDTIFYSVPGHTIIQGAHVKVQEGRVCGLFGQNGSGKSTLMRVAAGQIRATSGLTIINGLRLSKRERRARFERIGYLPQKSMLPRDITVQRVIRAARQQELSEDVVLKKLRSRRIGDLSGGERRYLEVVLVLGLGRQYVLLDEPFSGVEPKIIDQICERIRWAAESGCGVLVTDHYYQYVLSIADDAYLMRHKQCYRLEGNIAEELERVRYIGP
ncbi:MAG: ATP-binding cassette domain-containing protein [Bacteroidetes bacterium]|jgi:lipopolysaccharide export system ATP-binding protein|nr:ATP-binding cassette domain-containing protein [Bacteroidota bacterium]